MCKGPTFRKSRPSTPIVIYKSVVVIVTYPVSYVLLIHAVSNSRQTFADLNQTKREMWKIMDQKNAADQALREEIGFISIASNELSYTIIQAMSEKLIAMRNAAVGKILRWGTGETAPVSEQPSPIHLAEK
jgi:hypothetical protein